jgi:hypothetical protein
MSSDPLNDFAFLVLNALPGLGCADITIPEIGNSADNQTGLAIRPGQNDEFIIRMLRGTSHHMDIQKFQKFPGRIQKGRRIMISGNDNDMPIGGGRDTAQKAVIQFLGPITGGRIVKDISRNQEHIDIFAFNKFREPVQKSLKLIVSFAVIKGTANVPVGGMEEFHGVLYVLSKPLIVL